MRTRLALIAIFSLSLLLHVLLALVNREANDDHLTVIGFIQIEGYYPHFDDCWEGFQPKLYHAFCAWTGRLLDIRTLDSAYIAFQMINVIAGMMTLMILFLFLQELAIRDDVRILSFAGIALNPKFIAINAQVTNDSFVILFGTLTIYSLWRFLQTRGMAVGILMICATILACLSKVTGIVVFPGVLLVLLITSLARWSDVDERKAFLKPLIVLIILFLLIVPYFGQYYYNWKTTGHPFATPIAKSTPAKFFKYVPDPAYKNRLGVTTLLESWFTFRFIDLIRHPYITHGVAIEPRHRASLWTQLYGHAYFAHFDQFPLSWQNRGRFIMNVGRTIFILALLHFFLMLIGGATVLRGTVRGLLMNGPAFLGQQRNWIMQLFLAIFIAMILGLTYSNRDFSAMKAIYIFPAMICFLQCFTEGSQWLVQRIEKRRPLLIGVYAWFVALYALYTVDVTFLIAQLA